MRKRVRGYKQDVNEKWHHRLPYLWTAC